ncbi:MAG: transposase [Saprospiraceae bacterium]|nr:transposase [Saprospiraceae bacterium]
MGGHKIRDQNGLYFLTFTVVGWVDVFTRKVHCDIIIDALKYCQKNKGLFIYAYVIMSNHIHLVVSTKENYNLSTVIRHFKSFSARKIIDSIKTSRKESRKEWILQLFKQFASKNNCRSEFQFWKNGSRPIVLYSPRFINQKIDYIHLNPVKAGIVVNPEDYNYSSAKNYIGVKHKLQIDLIVLMSYIGYLPNN